MLNNNFSIILFLIFHHFHYKERKVILKKLLRRLKCVKDAGEEAHGQKYLF